MEEINYILNNVDNICNTSNELLNRFTVNRNFKKLTENDVALNELYEVVAKNGIDIAQYVDGTAYSKGQLVWFNDVNINGKMSLYLLESMFDNNTSRPKLQYTYNNRYSFEASGWKDKNEYTTIIENNLSSYIIQEFVSKVNAYHDFDRDYHKYGKLNTKEVVDSKLMLRDMSNINADRKKNYFPYQTVNLSSDDVIMSGTYRKWDNGLLEYDIVFKLAYFGRKTQNGAEYDVLSCNTFEIADEDIELNSKYFMDENARNIFKNNSKGFSMILESTIQENRNNFVNTYSGTIVLQQPFKDTNYMIFQSDVRTQERDVGKQTIDASSNAMTYANKKKTEFTALYMMFPMPGKYDATKNGLVQNSFHCHIIGRWK